MPIKKHWSVVIYQNSKIFTKISCQYSSFEKVASIVINHKDGTLSRFVF